MNTVEKLIAMSEKITMMMEELDHMVESTNNESLSELLEYNIRPQMEATLMQLESTTEDISDGMYDGEEEYVEEEDRD
tara:strand:- start:7 stop:240 length:234 start_codon:yes stop_codon:yes gene_type:complete